MVERVFNPKRPRIFGLPQAPPPGLLGVFPKASILVFDIMVQWERSQGFDCDFVKIFLGSSHRFLPWNIIDGPPSRYYYTMGQTVIEITKWNGIFLHCKYLNAWFECNDIVYSRARPDWAYDFPDRTGPDTQICRTGPAGPDWIRTYISKHFSYQLQVITSHKINLVSKNPRPNK